MSIITKSQLSQFRSNRPYSIVNESISARSRMKKSNEVSIFLSHKHDELGELKDAIVFLNSQGVAVYVDWLDENMPKATSGKTAIRIKSKIKDKRKFVFLATEGAINSKWCNWELGIGDVHKYIDHIAILPIRNNYSDYSGNEYLSIYPYIYESDTTKGSFFVKFPTNSGKSLISLSKWLTL
jgi:hypothetical protein